MTSGRGEPIGIVGGGISGLFLLHLLRRRGEDAILFEAAETPGGVMQSRLLSGPNGEVAVDLGPQRTRLTTRLSGIIDEVGLTDRLKMARTGVPFSMVHRGELIPVPMSPGEALRTPLISWAGKVRALADLLTPPPAPGESVADALRRKLGPEIYRRIAGPLLGGLYGSDPEEMEARHTLNSALARTGERRSLLRALLRARSFEAVPVVSFEGGLAELQAALSRTHAEAVRLGAPVRSIERTHGEGFQLVLDGESVAVRAVVLTLPAPEGAPLLHSLAPAAAKALGSLRYNDLAVVPLVVPSGTPLPAIGSGYKRTLDEQHFATRGVTAHDTLFDRRGLFTAFLGGRGGERFLELPDPDLLDIAVREFREVTGATPVPLAVHRTWMPAWDRSWAALDRLELPAGVFSCAAWAHRPGIAGRLEDAERVASALSR